MFEKLLLGRVDVGTLFGLKLLPCATQREGDLANRREIFASSMTTLHHKPSKHHNLFEQQYDQRRGAFY
jgi:hypothetical protein